MKKFVLHLGAVLFVLALSLAIAQHRPIYPHPPAPADPKPSPQATSGLGKPHLDGLQLQREARELSDLAKSIPLDIEQVNRGLLPKDTLQKLKRIEKISKHLRGKLAP